MDKTDIKILSALLNDCRMSNNKISQMVGISSAAVATRIEKMLQSKIIKKFSLSIEPLVFGHNIVYFVTVGQDWKSILKKLELIGKPYFVVPCIGGLTICSILTNENISKVTTIAKKLLADIRILNIFEAPSFDINQVLTKTDLKILQILLEEPRAQIDYLAEKTGYSTKTVSRSLEKLRNNDIIHFTLDYDPSKLKNFISFAVLVYSKNDVKKTAINVENKLGNWYLQKPWLSKSQFVLFFYSDNIYKLDEITDIIRNTDGVEATDLFIPKSASFPQEWVRKGIENTLKSPKLHIST